MLHDAGADIRFIQALLGHAKLTTTEIYTQVSIRQLKAIHTACHPSSKAKRSGERPGDQKGGDGTAPKGNGDQGGTV